LPELPEAKKQRFKNQYALDDENANTLTSSRQLADYFETAVKDSGCEARLCANWVTGDLMAALNKAGLDITRTPVSQHQLAGLLLRIADNTISGKIGKQVFEALWQSENEQTADDIIAAKGLKQITDSGAIETIIDKVIADNPVQVEQYRSGKDKVFAFFVGQVMKAMQGKANPAEVNRMLIEKLK
jgi:aspartyl-tRNA(Asn)/glutamyl-tRNA(Gln) amidotransferase subunit B